MARYIWQDRKDSANKKHLSEYGKTIYKRRKETVERRFADAKELNGYRYARFRGLGKVQALMTAIAQNIKKIAFAGRFKVKKAIKWRLSRYEV